MPSTRRKAKWIPRQGLQNARTPSPQRQQYLLQQDPVLLDDGCFRSGNDRGPSAVTCVSGVGAVVPSSASALAKGLELATSSLGGADGDEEMGDSGGGNHPSGVTTASLAPSVSSDSARGSTAESPTSPAANSPTVQPMVCEADDPARASGDGGHACCGGSCDGHDSANGVDEDEEREEAMLETAITTASAVENASGELFHVGLDPESQLMTAVLPEMHNLHFHLMHLVPQLRCDAAELRVLRDRARCAGDDLCELMPPPLSSSLNACSPPPSASRSHRHVSDGDGRRTSVFSGTAASISPTTSARNSARERTTGPDDRRTSPQAARPLRPAGAVSSPPLGPSNPCVRHQHGGANDEDSEWCDAATIHSSRSTTAHSTPSLRPGLPPPSLQFFEEDELDDDGRGSYMSGLTGARRFFAARFRPDSVPSSAQSTPSMHPAGVSYARSDGGGMLSLPPSTSAVGRMQLPRHASPWKSMPSPTAPSPSGSVMSRLENSPLLPPPTSNGATMMPLSASPVGAITVVGEVDDDTPPSVLVITLRDSTPQRGQLSKEKAELTRLSHRVAELYCRRGALLQRADRILAQHAQQHERWEGNEERRGCYRCRRLFSRLTRRHHCRRCGRLCCAECSRYVGKKQDTSYVAPSTSSSSPHGAAAYVAHHVIIKSEYVASITAEDAHDLVEEHFDEHTYPRRGGGGGSPLTPKEPDAETQSPVVDFDEDEHLSDIDNNRAGRARQHKWVRVCAPCYQNCLRARRKNVLQRLKNANLCILDDGFYYYHVMTKEELCRLSTALSKPDSFKKQMELMSHVVVERSVDYVAAAPAYSAHTLATAAHHAPDVLRTLGNLSAYALRSARQTANDYVGGYFASSRTILPDNPVGAAAALSSRCAESHGFGVEGCDDHGDACSEASVMSLEDTCSETQSPPERDMSVDDAAAVDGDGNREDDPSSGEPAATGDAEDDLETP